ncbi:MAG: electron transfer flavoprotein subunit beta/FixA family protein [Acidobacteriota bacterium]
MKIATCLAEVPARETRYELNTDGSWIKETDLSYEINECDEYALEEALVLRGKHSGEVAIMTVGRERSEKSMRKGLAMGADRGILVLDEETRLTSPHAVATAMAEVLKQETFDLILAGTQSDHYSYAETGVILAELLGLPHATIVMEIEASPEEKRVKALREMESGAFQWVELPLPAVLTIQAGISKVRFASLKGIMQAKKKEIRKVRLGELEIDLGSIPQLEIRRLYFPEPTARAEMLQGDAESVAEQLIEKLRKEERVI